MFCAYDITKPVRYQSRFDIKAGPELTIVYSWSRTPRNAGGSGTGYPQLVPVKHFTDALNEYLAKIDVQYVRLESQQQQQHNLYM